MVKFVTRYRATAFKSALTSLHSVSVRTAREAPCIKGMNNLSWEKPKDSGMLWQNTSPFRHWAHSNRSTIARWVLTTPLGSDILLDVYSRNDGLSSATACCGKGVSVWPECRTSWSISITGTALGQLSRVEPSI